MAVPAVVVPGEPRTGARAAGADSAAPSHARPTYERTGVTACNVQAAVDDAVPSTGTEPATVFDVTGGDHSPTRAGGIAP